MTEDISNGWEAVAEEFMQVRSSSGLKTVSDWAAVLPSGASVLDIGAGSGKPITAVLIERGFQVQAIDAAPSLVAAFRQNFPNIEIICEAAEESSFFDRTFDAIIAIGLIFLLPEDKQRRLVGRMADALKPGGRLLFSAPRQIGVWDDLLTGRPSWSLGADAYTEILTSNGLELVNSYVDEGGSHYYDACKSGYAAD